MKQDDAKKYLMGLAKQSGFVEAGLDDHINSCVNMGAKHAWAASDWSFKEQLYTLPITESVERYELPSNFESVMCVREQSSQKGDGLVYYRLEEFNSMVPRPLALQTGYPAIYTVYHDNKDKKWYIKFYPVPQSGYTIPMEIQTEYESMDMIPDKFDEMVLLSMEKLLYKAGSLERQTAKKDYLDSVKRFETLDSSFRGRIFKRLDDADIQIVTERPWI